MDMPTRPSAAMARARVGIIRRETHGETLRLPTISHGNRAERIKALAAHHAEEEIHRPIRGAAGPEATPDAAPVGRMAHRAIVIQMSSPTTTGSAIRRRDCASSHAHAFSEDTVPAVKAWAGASTVSPCGT